MNRPTGCCPKTTTPRKGKIHCCWPSGARGGGKYGLAAGRPPAISVPAICDAGVAGVRNPARPRGFDANWNRSIVPFLPVSHPPPTRSPALLPKPSELSGPVQLPRAREPSPDSKALP